MLITLPNADFSSTGLGTVQRLIGGMPQTDLAGLWLFDQGSDGDQITSILDSSGNGRNATLMPNWTAAVKRSYGAEVASSDGVAYETDLPLNPAGRKMTVFVAGRNALPGNEAGVYNNWTGDANSADMADPATVQANVPELVLNYNGVSTGRWQLYDGSADMMGTTTLTTAPDDYLNAPSVAGIETNGADGITKLHVLGANAATITDSRISDFYDGSTDRGRLAFGPWAHGGTNSVNTTIAHIYAVAAYYRTFTDAEAAAHMQAMQKIAEARGVAF